MLSTWLAVTLFLISISRPRCPVWEKFWSGSIELRSLGNMTPAPGTGPIHWVFRQLTVDNSEWDNFCVLCQKMILKSEHFETELKWPHLGCQLQDPPINLRPQLGGRVLALLDVPVLVVTRLRHQRLLVYRPLRLHVLLLLHLLHLDGPEVVGHGAGEAGGALGVHQNGSCSRGAVRGVLQGLAILISTGRIRIQCHDIVGLISGQDYYEFGVNKMWQSGLVLSRLWSKSASQIKTSDTLVVIKPSPL